VKYPFCHKKESEIPFLNCSRPYNDPIQQTLKEALFESLERRGRKGFWGRGIYGKIDKSFTFFKSVFFENDNLMLMINIVLILRIL